MGPAANLANEALLLDLAPELTERRFEFFGVFDNDSQVRFTSFSPQSRPGADKALPEGYGLEMAEGGGGSRNQAWPKVIEGQQPVSRLE